MKIAKEQFVDYGTTCIVSCYDLFEMIPVQLPIASFFLHVTRIKQGSPETLGFGNANSCWQNNKSKQTFWFVSEVKVQFDWIPQRH